MDEKNIRSILTARRVVPEIQREYVWGTQEDIVTGFLASLNNSFPAKVNIGFLYDYNSDNEFLLIDGQQRLTTLVLLCIYCANRENKVAACSAVLSNFSYRVRSTTDEFLQQLIKTEITDFTVDAIKSLRFYHESLRNDKSVEAMIKCLGTIDMFCKHNELRITLDLLLDKVCFWIFDVGQTSQGEELYISMNSRGADLTMPDQIKPMLLSAGKGTSSSKGNSWGKEWDNWEDSLFCLSQDVSAVDLAMERLIRATLDLNTGELHSKIDPPTDAKLITLSQLEQVHAAYIQLSPNHSQSTKALFETNQKEADQFLIEALIASAVAGHDDAEISRVEHVVRNWSKQSLIKKPTEFVKFIYRYRTSGQNLYQFIGDSYATEESHSDIFSHHEFVKINVCALPDVGPKAEKLFWEAEDLLATGGCICCIWQEAFADDFSWDDQKSDIFKSRLEIFKNLFADENIKRLTSRDYDYGVIDNKLITRALLALNQGAYHRWVSGQNYAFGYADSWSMLLSSSRAWNLVSALIDKIYDSGSENIYDSLSAIASEGKRIFDKKDVRYYMLNYPRALNAAGEGHNKISLGEYNNWNNFDVYILNKENAHSHYVQMFCSLVYDSIRNEIPGVSNWLYFDEKKIQLRCPSQGGWNVLFDEDFSGSIEHVKTLLIEAFGKDRIVENMDPGKKFPRYYVPLLDNENQVDLGIRICRIINKI